MEARPACACIVANSGCIWSFHQGPPPTTSRAAGFAKPKPKACTQAVPCNATCLLMCGLGRRDRARPRPFALWVQRMVSGIECSFPNMCQVKEEKMSRGLAPKAKLVLKVHLQPGIRSRASIDACRSPTTHRASGRHRQWRQRVVACRSSSHVKQRCAGGKAEGTGSGGSM